MRGIYNEMLGLETEVTPTEQANPALRDVESTAKALEGESKLKLSPIKMVGQLTKNLQNLGDRKKLKTAMGDFGYNYKIGDVEVTLSDDFDFG